MPEIIAKGYDGIEYPIELDEPDYLLYKRWKWFVQKNGYVRRSAKLPDGTNKTIYLHRAILGIVFIPEFEGDHIDTNIHNMKRSNLQRVTPKHNKVLRDQRRLES